jgi:parallel beta-helix repeat protein
VNVRRVGLYVTSGRDIAVENCAFENTNGLAPEAGLQVQPGSGAVVEHVRITGSLFRNNRGTGISFQNAAGARLAQISITDNTIDGNLRGIAVAQASHLVLEGNRISGHSIKPNAGLTLGLGIFDATVTGNLLENNYRGIQADGASMVTLGANTIIGTGPRPALGLGAGADGDGITCGAAAGPAVSQCVVTGNVVSRSAGNGIRVLRSAYTIVADNVVTESGQQGISLQAVSDSQVRGNTVSRSSLESARSYDDIQIGAGSQRNVVAFNQCPYGGSPRSSIYVAATSIDTLVAENRLLGGAGLSNNSTTTSTNWDGSSADWNR